MAFVTGACGDQPIDAVDDHTSPTSSNRGELPEALALNLVMIDQPLLVEDASSSVRTALLTVRDRIAAAGIS